MLFFDDPPPRGACEPPRACSMCAEQCAHIDRLEILLARAESDLARTRAELDTLKTAVQHLRTQTGGAR